MSTAPTYPSEQQLAQQALEKIRALCKGNGIKTDAITIAKHDISLHTLHAGTYLELKPVMAEKTVPGKIVSGTLVTNREEAIKQVDQNMISAARDQSAKMQITTTLLGRADKGFGLSGQALPLDFLKKDFTYHDACGTCRGSGKGPCPKCHGNRTETCIKCTGRGLMVCPLCRSSGLIQGKACTRCHGQRYVSCDVCKRAGVMVCRTCSGAGVAKCGACGGQGYKSHVVTLNAVALTYFEYDGKTIPKNAADMIETSAAQLVIDNKIKIEGRVADDKENVLGASYEVTFPYGDFTFLLGKKEITTGVFGYKADLVTFPYILDKLVQKGVEDLEEAANDVGSVADKIKTATRYRLIAQAFLLSAKFDASKATTMLLKKYDMGLSHTLAEKIVTLADQTTSRITKKPRIHGLMMGLAATTFILALYYLAPVRAMIAGFLPSPKFDFILDIMPVVLGGILTTFAIQLRAARSIRVALGHLTNPNQKRPIMPKAGRMAWMGYGGTFILVLAMMEISVAISQTPPYWYVFLRSMLLP